MRIEFGLLRTRVARRILLLFVLSALLPAGALSVVAYDQVRTQLVNQSRERLAKVSKSAGMAVYERLIYLQSQLELLRPRGVGPPSVPDELPGLEAVAVSGASGAQEPFLGTLAPVAPLTPDEHTHLARGRGLVRVRHAGGETPEILVGVAAADGDPEAGVIWGRVDPSFLWTSAQGYAGLSTTAGFCVFDAGFEPLRCDLRDLTDAASQLSTLRSDQRGFVTLEWTDDAGHEYLAGAWQIFLEAAFAAPSWDVLVAEDRAEFLAPLVSFRLAFLPVVIFGLAVVAYLSNVQIRRSLEPLEELGGATRRIAQKDFNARVFVNSGDEFEELAASFNTMAHSLKAQFSALEAIAEIDRAILSELDRERIVTTVLERVGGMFPSDHLAVVLEDPEQERRGRLYVPSPDGTASPRWAVDVDTTPLAACVDGVAHAILELDGQTKDVRATLGADDAGELGAAVVVPLWLHGEPAGYIALGHNEPPRYAEDDLSRIRQIADQVAVALSNADLLDELENLTWGSLTALARAIDAKSPWTAGHSERVTTVAQQIGRALGLDEATMETLRRGGLLHDIGKIGIPGEILDKPGRLTDDEARVMESHTRVGARILEPIAALETAIGIVLYHHERFDGKGYPDGLAGEDIPFLARILAVADVYDALSSDRPYRAGLDHAQAVDRIGQARGTHFDPAVVEAFLKIAHTEARIEV